MANYIDSMKKNLIEQFRDKPYIEALMEVLGSELQELYDFLVALSDEVDVNSAIGKQLDGIGDIVVLTRMEAGQLAGNPIPFEVIDDDTYRQYLIYKILKNTCDCTYPDIIKGLKMFWDRPLYYTEDLEQPATMIFDTGEMEGNVDTTPLFKTPLIRAAGITLKLYARTKIEMETVHLRIVSGLGYALTESILPVIELDYHFDSELHMRSGYITVTHDHLPGIERDYMFSSKLSVGASYSRVTNDTLPAVERDYNLNFKMRIGGAHGSTSYDEIPGLERRISYNSKIGAASAVHSILETPIGGVISQ